MNIVVTTQAQAFPAGTNAVGVQITVTDANNNTVAKHIVAAAPYELPVDPAWPVGTYTVTAQSVDASGAFIGAAISQPFTVDAPVEVQVPLSIAVA